MISLRLVFALIIFVGFAASILSASATTSRADVVDRLGSVLATHDPVRVIMAYRAMGDYGRPAAAAVESAVSRMGRERLENDDVEAAARIFWLVTETFPASANAWESLAEATAARGDHELAVRYFKKSLDLDACNRNAALMLERVAGEGQEPEFDTSEA